MTSTASVGTSNSTDNDESSLCPICSKPNHGHLSVTCKKCRAQTHYNCSGLSKTKGHGRNYVCFKCKTTSNPQSTTNSPMNELIDKHASEPQPTEKQVGDLQSTTHLPL